MWKRILLAGALGLFAGCGGVRNVEHGQLEGAAPAAPVRFFFDTKGGRAEAFLVRPEGAGPFPLIVLVHGHNRNGSGAEVLTPVAELFANNLCYAGLAISLPGYGATEVAN